jgi:glycine cleavage system H lipoate-binding protein
VSKDIASINKNAEDAWLVKIKVNDAKELDSLLTKEQYLKTIKK